MIKLYYIDGKCHNKSHHFIQLIVNNNIESPCYILHVTEFIILSIVQVVGNNIYESEDGSKNHSNSD